MKPLFLSSKASFLSVRRHKLMFADYIHRREEFFTARHLPFDSVVIYKAGGSVSFEAVRFLMQHRVPIIHLNWDGNQVAVTLPPGPISGELRLAQYQAYLDPKRRNQLAWAVVREKIAKSLDLLRYFQRRYPEINLPEVGSLLSLPTPMIVEAKVAERYWVEFAKVIHAAQPRLDYLGRRQGSNNMGACDPVNALLNYGYGILEAKVRVALHLSGLDIDIGFLHVPQRGATPLVYDVMELFRWIVDLTIIELVEAKKVKPEDFETTTDYKVRVKEEAGHRVVERLTQNFNRTVQVGRQHVQYDTVLDRDVRQLARFFLGDIKNVNFSCPFSADDSKVDADLVQRLLAMDVKERKERGISKTTYHYIRKHALAGEPFRLYAKIKDKVLGST